MPYLIRVNEIWVLFLNPYLTPYLNIYYCILYGTIVKTCYRCQVSKPLEEFDIRRVSRDGHDQTCKPCKSAHQKALRQSKAERMDALPDLFDLFHYKKTVALSALFFDTKVCTKCGKSKPLAEFPVRKNRPTARHPECLLCHRQTWQDGKEKYSKTTKAYYEANYNDLYARKQLARQANPDRILLDAERRKRRKEANPDQVKAEMRNAGLKWKYGISQEDYDRMVSQQNGLCFICSKPPVVNQLVVDHNHFTGQVRDLLCHKCNAALGQVEENVAILEAMIAYIRKWQPKEPSNPPQEQQSVQQAPFISTAILP